MCQTAKNKVWQTFAALPPDQTYEQHLNSSGSQLRPAADRDVLFITQPHLQQFTLGSPDTVASKELSSKDASLKLYFTGLYEHAVLWMISQSHLWMLA